MEGLRAAIEAADTVDGGEPVEETRTELDASGAAVTSKGHKGYYFFDSKGKRLPNKWCVCSIEECALLAACVPPAALRACVPTRDSFDVDKALNEVESAAGSRKASVQLTPASLLKDVQRHALEVEDLLHSLDDVSANLNM